MENAKRKVEEILTSLPEDSSLEDIQYHIYVRQKIAVEYIAKDSPSYAAALASRADVAANS